MQLHTICIPPTWASCPHSEQVGSMPSPCSTCRGLVQFRLLEAGGNEVGGGNWHLNRNSFIFCLPAMPQSAKDGSYATGSRCFLLRCLCLEIQLDYCCWDLVMNLNTVLNDIECDWYFLICLWLAIASCCIQPCRKLVHSQIQKTWFKKFNQKTYERMIMQLSAF